MHLISTPRLEYSNVVHPCNHIYSVPKIFQDFRGDGYGLMGTTKKVMNAATLRKPTHFQPLKQFKSIHGVQMR